MVGEPRGTHFSTRPDVRVAVENFGPVEKGTVDIRPLTIFVGPSNTGKTYLAILIYAFHRILHGFSRFPILNNYRYFSTDDITISEDDLDRIVSKLDTSERPFHFSDLPESVCHAMQSTLDNHEFLANDLKIELERCFDIESVYNLIRMSMHSNGTKVSISTREGGRDLWDFHMRISGSNIKSEGKIEDIILMSERDSDKERLLRRLSRFRHLSMDTNRERVKRQLIYILNDFMDYLSSSMSRKQGEAFYLPAARSGVMQSHRVIASSLVARSTRAGLERFPELPTFSGVMADFIQRLILYDESDPLDLFPPRRRPAETMKSLADMLEFRTLGGEIQAKRPSPGSYPEFVYRHRETKQDIRLSRASSMVSELAPVVLFLRGIVGSGDTLIIEEPEAHLHPAAQTEMAVVLARLVSSGVRVVVTTHSDWLLHEIGNLMRAGALSETTGGSEPGPEGFLRPDEVGVWLFRREGDAEGSTIREIPFDSVEGVQPDDYEDVAEQLYNRSADLQNRLEEAAARGKTRT